MPNDPDIGNGVNATCKNLFIEGGTLSISSDGTLDIDGNITIYSGATFSAANQINIAGSFSNGGTFTANSSELIFDATSGEYSINSGGSVINDITFSDAASWTLGAALDINGDYTNSAATVDVSSDNYSINCAGDWSNSGIFNYQNGTVTFDGTNQELTGTNNSFYNLSLNNSGTKTLSSNVDVNYNLTYGGTSVTLAAGTWDLQISL